MAILRSRAVTCALLAPPVGPKVVMAEPASEWLMPGSVVEVTMQEEGLVGMKATATVVALDGKKVQIEHDAFNDEGDESKKLREWVNVRILTPPPPPPPDGFIASLKVGSKLEVFFEDGWWEVTLLKKEASTSSKQPFLVGSAMYNTERQASSAELRPSWSFKGGRWQADTSVVAMQPGGGAGAAKAGGGARKAGSKSKASPAGAAAQNGSGAAKKARASSGGASSAGAGSSKRSSKQQAEPSQPRQPRKSVGGGGGGGAAAANGGGGSSSAAASHVSGGGGGGGSAGPSALTLGPVGGYSDGGWAELPLHKKVAEVLEAPTTNGPGGIWQPDGVDATLARLLAFRAEEAATRGLPPDEVDERLWQGAAEEGWRVHATTSDGHYRYTAPDGTKLSSKAEAIALGQEAKKSGRGRKSPTSRA